MMRRKTTHRFCSTGWLPDRRVGVWLCIFVLVSPCVIQAASPRLEVLAPPSLEGVARHIEELGQEDFRSLLLLTGEMGFHRKIRVVLLVEENPVAQETPKWVTGYARGDRAVIVLFPSRVPAYPDRNLGVLLRHELTHILVWEASGGRSLPRWFNEGLATVAAREWGLEDRARYAAAVIGSGPRSLRDLDRAFSSGGARVARAYAFSAVLIRELRREYGGHVTAEILGGMREGLDFDGAFHQACGVSPESWAADYLRSQRFWTVWLPFISSTNTLWLLVSLLALVAIIRHRWGRRARFEVLDGEGGSVGPGESEGDPEQNNGI